MPKPSLVSTQARSQESVRKTLEAVANYEPTQVVVWWTSPDEGTGVEVSEGTERVKVVGALNAMAYELWNA